jgi:hypothetical protein
MKAKLCLVVFALGIAAGMLAPREASAACTCRKDLIQVTTNAIGFSVNGCFQAKTRCNNALVLGATDICHSLGYGDSCDHVFTYPFPCGLSGGQYSQYGEVVAGCIVCTP